MNLVKIVKKEIQYFDKAHKDVFSKRSEWGLLEQKIQSLFIQAKKEVDESGFFENLHVTGSFELNDYRDAKQYFIQLFWGNYPTGVKKVKYDEKTGKPKISHLAEQGGVLLFSQTYDGRVVVVITPHYTEFHTKKAKDIILKIFSRPSKINDEFIKWSIKSFLQYSRCTSLLGNGSILDHMKMKYLQFVDIRNKTKRNNKYFVFITTWCIPIIAIVVSILITII